MDGFHVLDGDSLQSWRLCADAWSRRFALHMCARGERAGNPSSVTPMNKQDDWCTTELIAVCWSATRECLFVMLFSLMSLECMRIRGHKRGVWMVESVQLRTAAFWA